MREHVGDAVRTAVPQGRQMGMGFERFGNMGPMQMGDGLGFAESLREQIYEGLRTRFVDGVREQVTEGIKDSIDEILREKLGTAVRASIVEQKVLGGFDPELLADSVRGRIAYAILERVTDAVRERLHAVHRDRLREAIRSAISEHGGSPEFTGFGTATH